MLQNPCVNCYSVPTLHLQQQQIILKLKNRYSAHLFKYMKLMRNIYNPDKERKFLEDEILFAHNRIV